MNARRVDMQMVRRPLPQGVAKADRTRDMIRTRLETIQRERDLPPESWSTPDSLPYELRLLADHLEYLGWDDLARLVHLELLALQRERRTERRNDTVDLLGCLTRLRRCLVRLACHDDALAVAEEERVLSLSLIGGYEHAPQSAEESRNAITKILGMLGRHEEAAESAAAGVAEMRELPAKADQDKESRLARALGAHASRLHRIDDLEAAIRVKAESVAVWRRRAQDAPVSVHGSLVTLGQWQAQAGRYDVAQAAFTEAVQALRDHVERDEESIWRFHLPRALDEQADRLASLGRHREALAATEEAVARYRGITEWTRARFQQALYEVKAYEDDEDEPTERRLPALDESRLDADLRWWRITLREKELVLGLALANHGVKLHTMGRFEPASAACDEAVALARGQTRSDPAVDDPAVDDPAADDPAAVEALASALTARARVLYGMGRYEDAAAAAREAVGLHTGPATGDPAADDAGLAMAYGALCVSASELGSHDEALAASTWSLETYRRLHASDPDGFAGLLAGALSDHGRVRSRRGDHDAALAATSESVESYGRLAERNPLRYGDGYAGALVVFAEVRLAAGRSRAEALASAEKAVVRYRDLAAELPEAYDRDLARARSVLDRAR